MSDNMKLIGQTPFSMRRIFFDIIFINMEISKIQ